MSDMQRRTYRSVFTKEVKSVKKLIQNNDEIGDILARFDTLTMTFVKLWSLDEQFLQDVMSKENLIEDEI